MPKDNLRSVQTIDELRLPTGKFWFLSTPYSKWRNLEDAAMEAIDISADLEALGIPHFAPIPATHDVARTAGINPRCAEFWTEINEPWLRAAHGCLVAEMDGWDTSDGVAHERKVFFAFERPILFLPKAFARRAVRQTHSKSGRL